MAIDRVDWHAESAEKAGFPYENGGTHIAFFLTWVIMNHLEGEDLQEDYSDELQKVRHREMTGYEFLEKMCDEKFIDDDLNAEGYAFTRYYYEESNQYLDSYNALFHEEMGRAEYSIEYNWEDYDKIASRIDLAFAKWKSEILR